MIELTDGNFHEEVERFSGLAVVDFWAPWCGPCQVLSPLIEEIANDMKDDPRVKFGTLMVDDNPETTEKFGVVSIPTVKIIRDGQAVDESVGVVPKDALIKKILAKVN